MTDHADLIAELQAKDPRDVMAWSDLLDRAADALEAAEAVDVDRDRATAEQAWDEGFAIGLNFDSDNYGFTNPYRESEARND